MRRLLLLVSLVLVSPSPGSAQVALWLPPTEGRSLALEYVRPHEPDAVRLWYGLESPGPIHGAFFLSGAWPVGRVRLLAEVPYGVVTGHASPCVDARCDQWAHGEALGNAALGAELPLVGRALRLQLGVRLPTQTVNQLWSNDYWGRYAAATGWNAARGDRSGAFTMGLTTGTALLDWRRTFAHGSSSLRVLAGSALVYDRNAAVSYGVNNQEIPANVWDVQWRGAAQLWQAVGPVLLSEGVSVLNRPNFGQPRVTDYEWGVSAGLELGPFTPLVQARIPRNQPESVPGGASRLDWWNLALSLQFRPR